MTQKVAAFAAKGMKAPNHVRTRNSVCDNTWDIGLFLAVEDVRDCRGNEPRLKNMTERAPHRHKNGRSEIRPPIQNKKIGRSERDPTQMWSG